MIKTIFTGAPLVDINMHPMISCYGLEMVEPNGKSVIVGVEDILASDYTWRAIIREGITLYPYVIDMTRDPMIPQCLVQFFVQTPKDTNLCDFELTFRSSDNELIAALAGRQALYTPERFTELREMLRFQVLEVHRKFLSKELSVRASLTNYLPSESNPLSEYRAQTVPGQLPNLDMKTETDELSLSIPTYTRLRGIYKRDKTTMDAIENYTSSQDEQDEGEDSGAERTAAFSDASSLSTPQGSFDLGTSSEPVALNIEYFEDLATLVDPVHFNVSMGFPFYDSIDYDNAASNTGMSYDPAFIVGSDSNNELPIPLPNEERYFKELQFAIRNGLQEENGYLTIAEVDDAITSGQHSSVLDGYLKDVCSLAFTLNRSHTGHCVRVASVEDDDESEDDIGLEIEGLYTASVTSLGKVTKTALEDTRVEALRASYRLFDGFEHIKAYIENYTWGADSWATALIILLRFGSRKPRLLYVPGKDTSKKTYFNLEVSKVTELSGDKTNWHPIPFEGGEEYKLVGLIVNDYTPQDVMGIRNIMGIVSPVQPLNFPIGVVLAKFYETVESPELTFVDMFAFIELLRMKTRIVGVTYDPANNPAIKFDHNVDVSVVDFSVVIENINTNSDMLIVCPNIILQQEFNTICAKCSANHKSLPVVSIKKNSMFKLLQNALTSELKTLVAVGSFITEKDPQRVADLSSAYNLGVKNLDKPVIDFVTFEKFAEFLSVYEELYKSGLLRTPIDVSGEIETVVNTFYQHKLESTTGKTSKQRIVDDYSSNFKINCNKIQQFYSISRRTQTGSEIVGFFGNFVDPKLNAKCFCIWNVGEFGNPPKEKLNPNTVDIAEIRKALGAPYLKFKAEGKLLSFMNVRVFCPESGTMDKMLRIS